MWYRTTFEVPEQVKELSLFFTEIDGKATVYINGQEIGGRHTAREPFQVSGALLKAGVNHVAVRVDHTHITELDLGGIIRPVYLVGRRGE